MPKVIYTEEHWQYVETWMQNHKGKQQDLRPQLEKDFENTFKIKVNGLSLMTGLCRRKRIQEDIDYILLVGTGRVIMCPNLEILNRKIRSVNGEKYTVYKKATIKIVEVM